MHIIILNQWEIPMWCTVKHTTKKNIWRENSIKRTFHLILIDEFSNIHELVCSFKVESKPNWWTKWWKHSQRRNLVSEDKEHVEGSGPENFSKIDRNRPCSNHFFGSYHDLINYSNQLSDGKSFFPFSCIDLC